MNPQVKIDSNTYQVSFDARLYSAVAIKKAAYKFAPHFGALLTLTDSGDTEVRIEFPQSVGENEQNEILRAFSNEVIDQDLREQLATETEATRNLILAEAFSRTSLLHQDD